MEFVTTETVPGREIQKTLGIARGNTVKALDILLAWFSYVPVFLRLFDADAGDDRSGPLRLN
ncbi:hypothetical protein EIK79_02140 [Halocatena pleomorpha]|uniref:Uncharacterized protein n=1 Tax=Halocatena pleomorpha TaxID=1785090 RepID=A0A3P3RLC6_9EURY|nr:hypothetical protein [Halocatena pleomorpha]RRJ33619.1 hypothetical protein EIK79_02140 [Halocatena pleomorpha]